MNWTEENTAKFRELYAQQHSHKWIAAQMGLTRNASIGKAHRLGLESRRNIHKPKTATGKPRKRKIYPRPPQARLEALVSLVPDLPPGHVVPVTLIELQDHHCRYPHDVTGKPMMYCGATKEAGAYCAHHCRIAYRLPERRAA